MSNQAGWPLSMKDALLLTGKGSPNALCGGAPALLHALRTRHSAAEAPYLNQARATYPGGVSELDVALHLLHSPEEDLEFAEVRIFLEGLGEAHPPRPRPTNPVYNGTRPTPPVRRTVLGFSPGTRLVPHPPAGRPHAAQLGPPTPVFIPSPGPWAPTTGDGPSGRSTRAPRCSSTSSQCAGTQSRSWVPRRATCTGRRTERRPCPAPPSRLLRPGTRYTRSCGGRGVTAICGVHLVRLPPAAPDDPRWPGVLSPNLCRWLWRTAWAQWLVCLPPQCRWTAHGPRPLGPRPRPAPPNPWHHTSPPTEHHRRTRGLEVQ